MLIELKPGEMVVPSPEVCVKCKGRLWCGPKCFILERHEKKQKSLNSLNRNEFQSVSPPGVFVSWHGYPKVNFSPMAPAIKEEDYWLLDDTDKWFGLEADKVISFRENLVRGNVSVGVNEAADPNYSLMDIQETLMAKKPVDVEMKLDGRPTSRGLSFSDFHAPMGPQAGLSNFSLASNPSINRKVEKFYYDTDAKSTDAMVEMFKGDVGVNQLHKVLSAGMLGVKKRRKFVPTRWSITAVDSNLSEYLIDEKIKYFSQLGEVELYHSSYLENYYYIMLIPKEWSYELIEVWKPGAGWNADSEEPLVMTDFEFFKGRKGYAENTAGGYYAVRIAIAEQLMRRRRQAAALVFREIGDAGTPSLGVWKCRETARDALKKRPLKFSDVGLALNYLKSRLSVPLKFYKKKSVLLDDVAYQKRIFDFS